MTGTIGAAIQSLDAAEFVDQVQRAEAAGVPVAWTTIGGAANADPLTAFGAAMMTTRTIRMGTAIIPTWPRHPVIIAQQALALAQLGGPERIRLGIGPSHEPTMVRNFGVRWEAPLLQLREYLTVIRALADEGAVDFEGRHVTARAQWRAPGGFEVLASALRPRSFELCGALTDGAISWMCPKAYLVSEALPAIARGAERGNRAAPPLIAHVPVAVSTDREKVRAIARRQLAGYQSIPFYLAMFREAGFPQASEGYSDELLDDLVVSGTEDEVVERLLTYLDAGCGEVLAHPLMEADDRTGSIDRALAAVGKAHAKAASR